MSADREAANERAGRIEVEGDKPKVEPTLRYFAEVRASLKNGQDALRDIEAELAAARRERDEWHIMAVNHGTQVEKLREALRRIADIPAVRDDAWQGMYDAGDIARDALADGEDET